MEKETILIPFSFGCFLLFILLVFGFSTSSFIATQITLSKSFITSKSLIQLTNELWNIIKFILGFIFFSVGISLLSLYSRRERENRHVFFTCFVAGFLFMLFFNFSIPSFFLLLSMLVAGVYIPSLASTSFQEFKKWKYFRIGSKSVSNVFIIINILLSIGVITEISVKHNEYQEFFSAEMEKTFSDLKANEITGVPDKAFLENYLNEMEIAIVRAVDKTYPYLVPEQKQLIIENVKEKTREIKELSITNSEFVKAYGRWLPLITGFSLWILLEFLRGLVFSTAGGLVSFTASKLFRTKASTYLT